MIPKSNLYLDTVTSAENSRNDIAKILTKFGIIKKRWTEAGPDNTFLEFLIDEPGKIPIKVKIMVPFVETNRRPGNRGSIKTEYDERRSYRFLYHYLKALLSVKDVGIMATEEIFMGHIVIPLPGGGETTLGEQLIKTVQSGRMPALDGFSIVPSSAKPQLEKMD